MFLMLSALAHQTAKVRIFLLSSWSQAVSLDFCDLHLIVLEVYLYYCYFRVLFPIVDSSLYMNFGFGKLQGVLGRKLICLEAE